MANWCNYQDLVLKVGNSPAAPPSAPAKRSRYTNGVLTFDPKEKVETRGQLQFTERASSTFSASGIVGPTSGNPNHPNPTLDKLATGKLELEVKDAKKRPKKGEKEGFTAWRKEANGVQAGLGFRPGEKRPYTHGETVNLVVRVRNVNKNLMAVRLVDRTINYIPAYFFDWPPSVTACAG